MEKRNWDMTERQQNIYGNLWHQAEKIFDWRTHHQGKRGTERYREGVRAFCKHLAIEYGSKNFKNISDKHLRSFVEASKETGVGASTIKTDLAAIRKLHAMLPKTRYELKMKNSEIGTDKRQNRMMDRFWRPEEVRSALQMAQSMNRQDVNWTFRITNSLGLRIEEATALTRSQIRDSLQNGYIALTKTKGGIARDVPLNAKARDVFKEILRVSDAEKIFTGHGRTHKQAMTRIQNWIGHHRESFTFETGQHRGALTFHGLRHGYASSEYNSRIEKGMSPREARLEVANLLGHGRDQVTNIYLQK